MKDKFSLFRSINFNQITTTIELLNRDQYSEKTLSKALHHFILQYQGEYTNDHYKLIERLIDKGADINTLGTSVTPLHIAAANGNKKMVNFLISKGADVCKIAEGRPPFFHAIDHKDESLGLDLYYKMQTKDPEKTKTELQEIFLHSQLKEM